MLFRNFNEIKIQLFDVQQQNTEHTREIAEMRITQNVQGECIGMLDRQVRVLQEQAQSFSQFINDNAHRNSNEDTNTSMNNVNNNIDRISQEIQERFNRSRNIFLFGFPEYDSDDMTERNIIAMLNNMNINSSDIQIRRVGRINAGRPRLVIVTLHSRAEVLKVLRNRQALPPGVRANEDKTF